MFKLLLFVVILVVLPIFNFLYTKKFKKNDYDHEKLAEFNYAETQEALNEEIYKKGKRVETWANNLFYATVITFVLSAFITAANTIPKNSPPISIIVQEMVFILSISLVMTFTPLAFYAIKNLYKRYQVYKKGGYTQDEFASIILKHQNYNNNC